MSTIILTKSNGTSDVTYTPQASKQFGVSEYINTASGLTAPETLKIAHNLRPANSKGTDIHTVTLTKAVVESVTGAFLQGSVSFQLRVPRSADFTIAMVKDLIAQLNSYVNLTANATALFNGATAEGDFNVTGPFNPSIA
jgi:hypothetical protein